MPDESNNQQENWQQPQQNNWQQPPQNNWQPQGPQGGWGGPPQVDPGKGLGIAALVLGIVSLVFIWYIYVSIPAGVVGIILGIIGKKKSQEVGLKNGMATAGMIISIIAVAITIIFWIACIACVSSVLDSGNWIY